MEAHADGEEGGPQQDLPRERVGGGWEMGGETEREGGREGGPES